MSVVDRIKLRSLAAAFALILVSMLVLRGHAEAPKQKEENPSSDRVMTAGEALKGMKELRDLPLTQLIPVMKSMSAGLGVSCTFCHTLKGDQIDVDAPEKEEQKTTRAMIKMVAEINQHDFGGQTQVGCFTCHAGHPQPQRFPPLPVSLVSAAASPSPTPAAPPAATLIDNFIAAIGGEAALGKITSCSMKGRYTAANGLTGSYESEAVAPGRVRDVIVTPRGNRERIAHDEIGWEKSSFGVRVFPKWQAVDTEIAQPLLLAKQLKDGYSRYDASTTSRIDDRDVFVLSAIRRDGRRERLYFDVANGLLVRRVTSTPMLVGLLPEQMDFSDYREVDGIKFPFTLRVAAPDPTSPSSTRMFDEVKLNVPIDSARFDKPGT